MTPLTLTPSLIPATRREVLIHGVHSADEDSVGEGTISQIRRGQQKREERIPRTSARAENQLLVRPPVKIAPNWSEANERTTQVHTLRGFSRGGESRWLIANEWICGCYSYACTSGRATTVGSSRWPWEAKRTRSPRWTNRSKEKGAAGEIRRGVRRSSS